MIGVCVKWVDTRPELDVHGLVADADERFGGMSPADQAALEWALRCGDRWGDDVVVITVGPTAADANLRAALACGADQAIRIDPGQAVSAGATTAALLAEHVRDCRLVWCGDYSSDRGTGSVPAFLAAELGAAQALGLIAVEPHESGEITATRRLDGGRREVLRVSAPAVLSLEGSTATLRRAPLAALLATPQITVLEAAAFDPGESGTRRPFRPRARVMPPPSGESALERVRALTAAGASTGGGETVVLDPVGGAERIITALREWGYLS